MSGAISTDPFEILNTERRFYKKLYSKQNTNVNSEEANSFLNNPNLLRLTEELSESCEGETTLKECETILNSFKTGNDTVHHSSYYQVFNHAITILGRQVLPSGIKPVPPFSPVSYTHLTLPTKLEV